MYAGNILVNYNFDERKNWMNTYLQRIMKQKLQMKNVSFDKIKRTVGTYVVIRAVAAG